MIWFVTYVKINLKLILLAKTKKNAYYGYLKVNIEITN